MPTIKVILNPVSGSGRGRLAREVIERALTEEGATFDIVETTASASAVALARDAVLEGWEIIAAAGGDGMANEVLNGMVEAATEGGRWPQGEPIGALGLIAIGTGNDFAWSLGLPCGDADAAARLLARGNERTVDIGRVQDELGSVRYFCNNFGAGFDAATTVESYKLRFLRGPLVFLVAVLRTIFLHYHAPLVTVRYDDEISTLPLLMASIANGRRTGGMFMIAPQALPDDGLLDITLAEQVSKLGIFRLLPYFIKGTHASQPTVSIGRSSHIVVESDAGLPVHVDGEIVRTDARRLDVSVLPKRLRIVC